MAGCPGKHAGLILQWAVGFVDWLGLFVEILHWHVKNCIVQSLADVATERE
jgi:hypothetical protein